MEGWDGGKRSEGRRNTDPGLLDVGFRVPDSAARPWNDGWGTSSWIPVKAASATAPPRHVGCQRLAGLPVDAVAGRRNATCDRAPR